MQELLQQVFNGVVIGSVYVLMAVGLTIIFGVMKIVNFAHGEFYMVGAYLAFYLVSVAGLPFFVALILASAIVGLCGILIERVIDKFGKDMVETDYTYFTILFTIAVSLILANTVNVLAGPSQHQIETGLSTAPITIGPVVVTAFKMLVIAIAFSVSIGFGLFLRFSRFGKAMRSTFANKEAAESVGINTTTINMATFAIGACMASVGGILVGAMFNIYPYMGSQASLKAFAVVILGGIGSFIGAILGGMSLGIIESIASAYFDVGYTQAISFVLIILVLVFRPEGIAGRVTM